MGGMSKEEFLNSFGTLQDNQLPNEDLLKDMQYGREDQNEFVGTARAFLGQGVGLGWGDEVEAFVSSKFNDKSYEENLKNIQKQIEDYKDQSPILAYGGEIAGSFLPTGLAGIGLKGVTKLGQVGKTALTGAVESGVYSAGAAEEGDRLKSGATGLAIGGVAGGTFSSLFPRASKVATELEKKGLKSLTMGQKFTEGPSGKLLKGFEETITSYIGFGGAVSEARARALSDFNKLTMLEAISPALSKAELNDVAKVLKRKHGNEAFAYISEQVSKKYDDVVQKLSIPEQGIGDLENQFRSILVKQYKNIIDPQDAKKALQIFNKHLTKNTKLIDDELVLKGDNLKYFEEALKKEAKDFKKAGGVTGKIGEAFEEISSGLKSSINTYNRSNQLNNVNKAYAGLVPLKIAVNKANKTEGIFSTNQLLDALKQADTGTKTKTMTAKGKNIFGQLPFDAQKVLGGSVADSGTASRLVSGSTLEGGLGEIMKTAGLSALGSILYSPAIQYGAKGILSSANPITKYSTPYATKTTEGLLGDSELTEEEKLLRMLK